MGMASTTKYNQKPMHLRWSNHKSHQKKGHNLCKMTDHPLACHKGESAEVLGRLTLEFRHLFCFVLVLNDLFPNVSICFSPIYQKLNAICFVLVPNDLFLMFSICFSPSYQKLNVICFVLVLNDLFQIFSICFSPGDQKPNVICSVLFWY